MTDTANYYSNSGTSHRGHKFEYEGEYDGTVIVSVTYEEEMVESNWGIILDVISRSGESEEEKLEKWLLRTKSFNAHKRVLRTSNFFQYKDVMKINRAIKRKRGSWQ